MNVLARFVLSGCLIVKAAHTDLGVAYLLRYAFADLGRALKPQMGYPAASEIWDTYSWIDFGGWTGEES